MGVSKIIIGFSVFVGGITRFRCFFLTVAEIRGLIFFPESFTTGAASGASVVLFVFSMSKIY